MTKWLRFCCVQFFVFLFYIHSLFSKRFNEFLYVLHYLIQCLMVPVSQRLQYELHFCDSLFASVCLIEVDRTEDLPKHFTVCLLCACVLQETVLTLLKEAMMKKAASSKGFLIDGYPRELDQGKRFEADVAAVECVLYFEVSRLCIFLCNSDRVLEVLFVRARLIFSLHVECFCEDFIDSSL